MSRVQINGDEALRSASLHPALSCPSSSQGSCSSSDSAGERCPSSSSSSCGDLIRVCVQFSMAALWLQSFSLLVLLVVSWPGSQAVSAPQHLCGSHLVDALYLVCGDNGFFYNPRRDVHPLLGETTLRLFGVRLWSFYTPSGSRCVSVVVFVLLVVFVSVLCNVETLCVIL